MDIDSIAPGLHTLGGTLGNLWQTLSALHDAWENGDIVGTIFALGVDALLPIVIIFAVIYLAFCAFFGYVRHQLFGKKAEDKAKGKEEERPLRVRRRPWYRRLNMWRRTVFVQPWTWKVGRVIAYLTQTHALIVGGSGSGKSTAVVTMILQPIPFAWWTLKGLFWRFMVALKKWGRRPVVILSFDITDPIEEATNVVEDLGVRVTRWRIRQPFGWDFLQGDIEMIAEAIPSVWSKTADDTGFFRQLMSDAIAEALTAMDAAGVQREWNDMVNRCEIIMDEDDEVPTLAKRTWIRRLRSMGRVLGESLGSDFDLLTELQACGVVHISSNSYQNPQLTPLIGVGGIVQVKRAASAVRNVILILEEAAFLKNRTREMDDLFRSLRARGWRILYLSQDPQDLGSVLQVNAGVALIMGLGPLAIASREWCAKVVKGMKGAFRAEELILNETLDQLEGYLIPGDGRNRGVVDVSLAPFIMGEAEHREVPERRPGKETPELDPSAFKDSQRQRNESNTGDEYSGADTETSGSENTEARAEVDDFEQELDDSPETREAVAELDLLRHKKAVEGPVERPEWVDAAKYSEDESDRAKLDNLWMRHRFPYGIDGCYETDLSVNAEGSNGRPRIGYMGQSWLAYALVLAIDEGMNLDLVREAMKARTLSADHSCENNRCVRRSHLKWKGSAAKNAKLWHRKRKVSFKLLSQEVEADNAELSA